MELRKASRVFATAPFSPFVSTFSRSSRVVSSLATPRGLTRGRHGVSASSAISGRLFFPLVSTCNSTRRSSRRYFATQSHSEDVSIKSQEKATDCPYDQGKETDQWVNWMKNKVDKDGDREASAQLGRHFLRAAMHTTEGDATTTTQQSTKEEAVKEALRYLKRAAQQDHADALVHLGWIHSDGVGGVERDSDKAKWYYEKAIAIDPSHPLALMSLGNLYEHGAGTVVKDGGKAMEHYTKAADSPQEFAEASFIVASHYYRGELVTQDVEKAYHYALKAYQQRHLKAYVLLGQLIEKGLGQPANPERAFELFKTAADHDDPDGLYEVARMYGLMLQSQQQAQQQQQQQQQAQQPPTALPPTGGSPSETKAKMFEYLKKAVEAGHLEAMHTVARMSFDAGQKAYELAEHVATRGHPGGKVLLAQMLALGRECESDLPRAVLLLQDAALNDEHPDALYKLALLYEGGVGVALDTSTAVELLKRAAMFGHPGAQKRLEEMLKELEKEEGDGEAKKEEGAKKG